MPETASHEKCVIGAKQVVKAIRANKVSKIYIASDSDPVVIRPVSEEAEGCGIDVEYIPTRKQLGELFGIRVKASCAAVINN